MTSGEQGLQCLETADEIKAATRIDSASDERVKNNVVRHEYRVLNEREKGQMRAFKDMGLAYIEMCDEMGKSRELSLAKTKMEEAVMWAVRHVTA